MPRLLHPSPFRKNNTIDVATIFYEYLEKVYCLHLGPNFRLGDASSSICVFSMLRQTPDSQN